MKFRKFLPLIGIVSTTATLPLVGCTSNNKYEIVQIDLDHIEDIVSMKNIQFLQDEELIYGPGGFQWAKEWMSPTVFHGIASGDVETFERYLWDEQGTIMETERDATQSWQWSEPEPSTMHQFRTPDLLGQMFANRCFMLKANKAELTFNKEKLCYSATFPFRGLSNTFEFYFLNNKLIKYIESFEQEAAESWGETIINITYTEVAPVLPI